MRQDMKVSGECAFGRIRVVPRSICFVSMFIGAELLFSPKYLKGATV